MTSEQQRAADAAVAENLGWERRDAPSSSAMPRHGWQRRGRPETWQPECPRYVSGAVWRLWGEMIDAIAERVLNGVESARVYAVPAALKTVANRMVTESITRLPEALYLVGVAAGLWPSVTKENDNEH